MCQQVLISYQLTVITFSLTFIMGFGDGDILDEDTIRFDYMVIHSHAKFQLMRYKMISIMKR